MTHIIYILSKDKILLNHSIKNPDMIMESIEKGTWHYPENFLSPQVMRFADGLIITERHNPAKRQLLTDRQKQVLGLYCEGQTHSQIAYTLGISVRSVQYHLQAIKERTGKYSMRDLLEFYMGPDS